MQDLLGWSISGTRYSILLSLKLNPTFTLARTGNSAPLFFPIAFQPQPRCGVLAKLLQDPIYTIGLAFSAYTRHSQSTQWSRLLADRFTKRFGEF